MGQAAEAHRGFGTGGHVAASAISRRLRCARLRLGTLWAGSGELGRDDHRVDANEPVVEVSYALDVITQRCSEETPRRLAAFRTAAWGDRRG